MKRNNKSKVDREIVKNCREAQAVQAAFVLDLMVDGADQLEIQDARLDLQEIESQLADALAGVRS